MKKIYEDGGDRPQIEDISSGAFDFSDTEPLQTRRETPPSPIKTNRPQQPEEAPAEGTVQLTQEQLQQLLALAAKQTEAAAKPDADPAAPKPVQDNGLGTRILYQSKDFAREEPIDEPSGPRKRSLSSFLEDEDDLSPVDVFDPRFRVAEVEEEAEDDLFDTAAPFASERSLPDSGVAVEESEEELLPDDEPEKEAHIGRTVVLVISLLAILFSVGVLLHEYKLHLDNKRFEEDVSDLILQTNAAAQPNAPGDVGNNLQLTEEQQWEQLRGEFPNVTFPKGLQLKYARLYATNQDFVGYLEAPGINMSLPVVQATDDEAYLNKNFYGKSTKYGCPFVSYLNQVEPLDYNTLIFGHHMNDRTIFGALDHYKTLAGYQQCPVISYNTLYHDYQWKVFAVFISNSVPEDDNGYVFPYYFTALSSDQRKAEYLNELKQRSLYDTGVDVQVSDRLLTLSTCSHEFDDARLVVVARLVRQGESATVDTSRVTLNANPRYPQVYYDKKRLGNPYANASRWFAG